MYSNYLLIVRHAWHVVLKNHSQHAQLFDAHSEWLVQFSPFAFNGAEVGAGVVGAGVVGTVLIQVPVSFSQAQVSLNSLQRVRSPAKSEHDTSVRSWHVPVYTQSPLATWWQPHLHESKLLQVRLSSPPVQSLAWLFQKQPLGVILLSSLSQDFLLETSLQVMESLQALVSQLNLHPLA